VKSPDIGISHKVGVRIMFGWFKKQPRTENTEAYKLGQQAGESMAADLEHFMSSRYEPAFKAFMRVLSDRFDTVYGSDDLPPITLARIEFKIFNDQVQEMREDMAGEITFAMRGWLEVDNVIGAQFRLLIDKTIRDFQDRLTMSGIQAFLDRADDLKAADIKWRRANPERAAQFPTEPN
jgi:hypothetical protein